MRPGLTLLCITKDQAPKLMRMLQSVQGVVEDIVVFDTGSKDLSPGVARMQGARVFQIEWPGSFSEALNQAMKEVRTEWTLRLDTDEWLPPNCGGEIRALMTRDDAFGFYFLRQDLTDETHFSESWLLRMWRTHPGLRFEGYVHEHVTDANLDTVAGKRLLYRVPIRFLHDGFMGGVTEAKNRRNLELLRKELELRPDDLYYLVELAMTLCAIDEPEGRQLADRLTERIVSAPGKPEPYSANALGTSLTHARDLDSERVQGILDYAWKWFDSCPPMLWAMAQAEHRRGNKEGVYRALLQLEAVSQSGDYEREWAFDGVILQEALWSSLAQIAAELGHEDVSARNKARLGTL
jgi:hypothetical protein